MRTELTNKIMKKIVPLILMVCLVINLMPDMNVQAADDDQIKASITVTPNNIYEDGVIDVDITLEGIPYEGKVMANDVVLVIDRSGSMSGDLNNMITAAKDFVDEVDLTTHRIGIVDYSHTVSSMPISKDRNAMKEYLDNLDRSGGSTRIDLGIDEAVSLLGSKRSGVEGSIVLMTDGAADSLELALEAAEKAKARGYSFYTVALTSSANSAANQNLKKMATSEADHYFVWPSSGLPDVYKQISKKIGYANAKNVVVSQVISDQFELVAGSTDSNIPQPTVDGQKLRWEMTQMGKGTAHLTYQLKVKDTTVPGTYKHVSSGSVVYTAYTGGSKSILLDKVVITVNKHKPELLTINQNNFDIAGGEQVVINGKYISNNAIVKVGSTIVSSATIANNQITFTMPSHAVGSDSITVTNPDNQVSAPLSVTFTSSMPLPTMTVTPSHGIEKKSQKVTVTGITLQAKSTSQLKVTVGGKAVSITSYNTTTKNTLSFYVPNTFSAGDVDIVITDKDGTKHTGQYTYDAKSVPAMEITSITPSSGEEKKSQKVTITGKNFNASTSYMKVTVGGTPVTLTTCTATTLAFYVPNTFSAGIQPIVVTNTKTNQTATTQYEYQAVTNNNPMTITSITPSSGEEKKSQKLTITGKNFNASTSYMKVTVGGTPVTLTTCTATTLAFYVPNTFSAGIQPIVVTNTKTNETATTQYVYQAVTNNNPMTITSITPSSGEEKKSQKVTITGKNFNASTSYMKVTVGGTPVTLTTCTTTTLAFYVPNTFSAGMQPIVVTNTKTNETATTQYEYQAVTNNNPMTITSISPASGEEKKSQKVTITGQNFSDSTSKMQVTVGGTPVTLTTCTTTTLAFYVPNTFLAGVYDVVVTRTDTNEVITKQYEYTAVTNNTAVEVTAVTPSSGMEGASQKVTITGTNFVSGGNFKVMIGAVELSPVSVTPTSIVVYVPNNLPAATYPIAVINKDGTKDVLTSGYTYTAKPADPSPSITTITPTVGTANKSVRIEITGAHLKGTTKGSKVTLDGQIMSLVTDTDTNIIFYAPSMVAGTYDIVITNSYGNSVTVSYTIQ